MKIMTLDLSTRCSGWCTGSDGNIEDHGWVKESSKDVIERIVRMRDELLQLVMTNSPQMILIQQIRMDGFSTHTSKMLLYLQAAIVLAIHEIDKNIKVEFIGASEWRAALGIKQGRGVRRDKLKPRDIQYVQDKYGITVNDDQADAICIFDAYWRKNDNELNWD